MDLLRAESEITGAAYKKEIFEIRATLSRVEDEAGWREGMFNMLLCHFESKLDSCCTQITYGKKLP